MSEHSKKMAYAVFATSLALIASNFSFAKTETVPIPGTPVFVPMPFLWAVLVFLLVPYAVETRQAKLGLGQRLEQRRTEYLERFFIRYFPDRAPNLIDTVLYPKLKWSIEPCWGGLGVRCDYIGFDPLDGRQTILRTVVAGPIRLLVANLRALPRELSSPKYRQLDVIERVTGPMVAVLMAVATKLYFLVSPFLYRLST